MIELYPPYKGTNKATGFECMVIALAVNQTIAGHPVAICIGEDGELYATSITNIVVDWRYNRKNAAWESINDEAVPAP